jgi:hypothetical protein
LAKKLAFYCENSYYKRKNKNCKGRYIAVTGEQLTPEGMSAQQSAEPQVAPVETGRGFLVPDDSLGFWNGFEIIDSDGYQRLVTPSDATGLPSCFAPTCKLPKPIQKLQPDAKRIADLNHMFPKYEVHTSASPALQTAEAKAALIGARGQWVPFEQHHGPYNTLFAGPRQPQTTAELLKTLTFAAAGFVPEQAIDLSGDEPKLVGLTKKQRKWLWTSGEVKVINPADVSRFLLRTVLATEADHIPQIEVEEFLYTFDYERKLSLATSIAAKIVARAAEPIEQAYKNVQRQNVLTFIRVGNQKFPVPDNPRDLLQVKLVAGRRRGIVRNALAMKLAHEPRRSIREYQETAV